jgi:predicted RNase H-like HicB family nuclease
MRKLTYLAVFEADESPGISVYFPDVPGCVSCGNTFDHALQMAKEALSLHLYGMEKDGEPLPTRSDKIPETGAGDMVVPVTVYPDMVKDEMNNRREKTHGYHTPMAQGSRRSGGYQLFPVAGNRN